MAQPPEKEWLTIEEAAERIGVTPASVRRYVREGLPSLLGRVRAVELLAEYRRRSKRERGTQATRRSSA